MASHHTVQNLHAETLSTGDISVTGNLLMKGVTVITPEKGTYVKIGLLSPGAIIAPLTALDQVTLMFPEHSTDGQLMFISFTQDVKQVFFTNSNFANASVLGPNVKAGDNVCLFYHGKTGKWYKLFGYTSGTTGAPGTAKLSHSHEDGCCEHDHSHEE